MSHLFPQVSVDQSLLEQLHHENQRLRQENSDLKIALSTTAEHGDIVESELHSTNIKLQAEVVERLKVEATLKTLVEMITRQKDDLEIIVQTIMEHGDILDTQWQQKFCTAMVQVDIDGLTQIANRRRFDEYFDQKWQQMAKSQNCLTVIMIDIDCFKPYNDTYGHQAGDRSLVQVADALRQCLNHPEDLVARYGGEEFVALLPGTDSAGAMKVAERMHQAALNLQIPHISSTILPIVTLSIGVASTTPNPSALREDLIRLADENLYQAKRLGKNRIVSTLYSV